MASSKQYKTEEAEAAAKIAARDLEELQREKRVEEESNHGVIGSVIKAVGSTVDTIKETVAGKASPPPPTAGETTTEYRVVEEPRGTDFGRDQKVYIFG